MAIREITFDMDEVRAHIAAQDRQTRQEVTR